MASNLKRQQIPEEHIKYYYYSSDSESSDEGDPMVQYPVDNLGTSWGSYLYSGPPTRAGPAGVLHRKAPNAIINTKKQVTLSTTEAKVRPMILPHPKGGAATEDQVEQQQDKSNATTMDGTLDSKNSSGVLLVEIQRLMNQLSTTEGDLNKNGCNTEQFQALVNKAKATFSNLQHISDDINEQNNIKETSSIVLVDVQRGFRKQPNN